MAPFAAVPVTRDILLWADRVFVLNEHEDQHRTLIRIRFPDVDRPIVDLDVEDDWRRGHPELVEISPAPAATPPRGSDAGPR